jgi:predicted enzyme related to lactoylglutathione lyase
MADFSYILAYVSDVPKSAALYGKLLALAPVESSPSFALFVLPSGVKFGLWAKQDVAPPANPPGGIELSLAVADEPAVHATLKTWSSLGLAVIQPPTRMDFGFTFTATDPDGHRLRVFAPA